MEVNKLLTNEVLREIVNTLGIDKTLRFYKNSTQYIEDPETQILWVEAQIALQRLREQLGVDT